MLVRADAWPRPATGSSPTFGVVERRWPHLAARGGPRSNLGQALEFAQRARVCDRAVAGEIVFAGAARVEADQAGAANRRPNLRVLLSGAPQENVRAAQNRIAAVARQRRIPGIFMSRVRNYGSKPHMSHLVVQFAGVRGRARGGFAETFGREQETFPYRTPRAAVWKPA